VNESVDDDACKKLIGCSLPRGPGHRGLAHWLSCSRLVVLFFGGTVAAPAPSLVDGLRCGLGFWFRMKLIA
jgi:hypothetical protein